MHASVRAFLNQIIDYAGLFPPAKLPLDAALMEYLHLKKASPYRWMLGEFVCPAARLAELLPLAQAHEGAALLQVTALGQQTSTVEDFLLQFETAIKAILQFRQAWRSEAVIDAIEIPVPGLTGIDRAVSCLEQAQEPLRHANLRGFFELPMSASWQADIARIAQRLHDLRDRQAEANLGLKLRCGGLTAEAFPSDAQVAGFIAQCRDSAVPWKATAGLHHPRRHWDASLNLWHHGFLNVFGAGVLAMAQPLTPADLVAILSDREGKHFRFEPERFFWKNWSCTVAQLAEFRAKAPTSFGSCSFTAPCADLATLGMLDKDPITS
jgi:hypothetical protein